MVYLYDACDQISDFCHQQLLRKMRRKISWTDEQTDRGNTVYPPPPSGSRGIKKNWFIRLHHLLDMFFPDTFSISEQQSSQCKSAAYDATFNTTHTTCGRVTAFPFVAPVFTPDSNGVLLNIYFLCSVLLSICVELYFSFDHCIVYPSIIYLYIYYPFGSFLFNTTNEVTCCFS